MIILVFDNLISDKHPGIHKYAWLPCLAPTSESINHIIICDQLSGELVCVNATINAIFSHRKKGLMSKFTCTFIKYLFRNYCLIVQVSLEHERINIYLLSIFINSSVSFELYQHKTIHPVHKCNNSSLLRC